MLYKKVVSGGSWGGGARIPIIHVRLLLLYLYVQGCPRIKFRDFKSQRKETLADPAVHVGGSENVKLNAN